MRLAPFYYFVLFIGWSSCSFVSDGPIWSLMNGLWYDCGSKLWAKLFMVGNLVGYQEPTEGCYFWTWCITCDLQLTLIIPFMVLFYNGGPLIGNFVMLIITAFAMWHACYQVNKYQLRGGFFAVENYNLLDKLFSKPWTYLHGYALGVAMAYLYI